MIKSNPLAVVLVTVLFLSALFSSWSAFWWYRGTKELQSIKYQYQNLNQVSTAVQSLANDAIEYGRRNPTIDSILVQYELKQRPVTPATPAQPAPKATR